MSGNKHDNEWTQDDILWEKLAQEIAQSEYEPPSERPRDDTFLVDLSTFLYREDGSVEKMLPRLLEILRAHGSTPLAMIAYMLDPAERRGWRLELKRGKPGTPRQRAISDLALAIEYDERKKAAETRGGRDGKKPGAVANEELGEAYGMTDEAVSGAVKRGRKQKLERLGVRTRPTSDSRKS
jgi:hypothetical protein